MTTTNPTSHPNAWSRDRSQAWQQSTGWLVGVNYTPRTAINAIEFWSAASFDAPTIRQELAWAQNLGFNSLRVFLHDLVWLEEQNRFLERFEQFLDTAAKYALGVMPVFFDSVWHPFPHSGPQPKPERGVHNSGWVQSPGVAALRNPLRFAKLESYVTAVMDRFASDPRIHAWDLWNEPDNPNTHSYGPRDLGVEKEHVVLPLLDQVFGWARNVSPKQPLTSGVWLGDWSEDARLRPIEQLQLHHSDVITFHCYGQTDDLTRRIDQLARFHKPLLCTEFMARGLGCTFESSLPVMKRHGVGAYCWGFVKGKTQTHLPWDSWQRPYENDPKTWFHDILSEDGSPHDPVEIQTIQKHTNIKPTTSPPVGSHLRTTDLIHI